MRIIYLLAWAAFFIALLTLSRCGRPEPGAGAIAARDLRANQPLKEGDVTLPGSDLYVARDLRRGSAIGARDVAHWPSMSTKAGKLAIAVPVAPGSDIKAGEPVLLCPAAGTPSRKTAAAVLCSPDRKACTAILELSPGEAAALAKAQAARRSTILSRSC